MMMMMFVMMMMNFTVFITLPIFECSLRWPWEAMDRFPRVEENSRPSGPETSTLLDKRRSQSLKRPIFGDMGWRQNINHPVSDSSVSDFPTLDFSLPACNT